MRGWTLRSSKQLLDKYWAEKTLKSRFEHATSCHTRSHYLYNIDGCSLYED